MISRILVPKDINPLKPEDARNNGSRKTTYMDDRTVVPMELSQTAAPLTGATTIPEHLPLGVLVDRTLVERGLPAKPFEDFGPINARQYPIDVLDTRVVVPAYVEPLAQEDVAKFERPAEISPDLREMVGNDILTTGEANLLVEPEEKRDAKADAFTRVASVIAHIAFIIFLVFLPKIFPPHIPTAAETEMDSKLLGVTYVPPDLGNLTKAPKPEGPPAPKITKKALTKAAPPRPENHTPAPEEPKPTAPPADLPSAPTPHETASNPPPAVVPPPTTPVTKPSELLPAAPPQPTRKLDLGLGNSSPNRTMNNDLKDAINHASGPSFDPGTQQLGRSDGGGQGRGHGGAQVGNGVSILTPTDGVDFNSYINRLVAKVRQNWMAVMPESAYLGDQGVVGVTFRINADGSFPADSLVLERTSGKTPLDTAAQSAIRASSPFEPLPPQFKRPYIDLRFGFYYNIKPPVSGAQ